MKKTFLAIVLMTSSMLFAQSPLGTNGRQINFGLGFGYGIPVYVGMDFAVHKDITIGPDLSFRSYNHKYGNLKYDQTIVGAVVRGDYHFNSIMNIPRNWDFYAGLNLGFVYLSDVDYPGYDGRTSGLGLGLQLGGRWYWSQNWGLNLEFNGGNIVSNGRFGVSYKF